MDGWRDPDSNRGHHDFQSAMTKTKKGVICRDLREDNAAEIPADACGFAWIWGWRGAPYPKRIARAGAKPRRSAHGRVIMPSIVRRYSRREPRVFCRTGYQSTDVADSSGSVIFVMPVPSAFIT